MPIDIILIAIFGYGFWQGFNRGIITTIFNVLAYVFGFIMAFKITPVTTHLLERMFNSTNPMMFLAAFIINLVFLMFVMRQAAKGLEGFFRAVYLGLINQVLGGLVLGFTAVLIYSVLIWFLVRVQFLNDETVAESKTYPFLKDLPAKAKSVAERMKPFAEDAWDTSMNWMNRLEKYGIDKTNTKPKVYELPDDHTVIEATPETTAPATTGKKKTAAPQQQDPGGIEQ